MAFKAVVACLLAVVAPCLCDTRFGAGSYTGGLLSGIGGLPGAGLGVGAGLGAIGAGAGVIGAGALPVVGAALDGLDDFGNPIGVIGDGPLGGAILDQSIGVIGGGGVGIGIFPRCGYFPRLCHATNFDRFPQCKYTFDHKLGRCVKVYVRRACAFRNGPRDNIFDSFLSCKRFCH